MLVYLVVNSFIGVSASQKVIRNKVQNDLFQGMSWVEYFYEESVYNV